MSIAKFLAIVAIAATASSAFADAKNALIGFSTKSDKYADGTPVKDGEWYACCWSADGVFEGITSDYKPLDSNDKIFELMPRAKNGRCPYTLFQIDSQIAPKGGKYCVIMLDTRAGGTGAVARGETQPERASNAAVASANYTVSFGSVESKTGATAAGWGATDPKPETPAKITKIDPAGDDVIIEIEDLYPGVRYDLKAGADLNKLNDYVLDMPISGSEKESAAVKLPKGEAKFYQLTTAPMTR